ncbi:MAG: hypothetical protein N3A54_06505, partial [Patescibacteria group bacterium]|nr:hypothetical protein [Patescibacteria group bacterium]
MVSKAVSGSKETGSEKAQYPGAIAIPEQWGNVFVGAGMFDPANSFTMKALSGGINSLIMTGMYHGFDGEGFANDYSKMNWQNMTASAYDLGNFLGGQANAFIKKRQGYDEKTQTYDLNKKTSSGFWEDMMGTVLRWSDEGDKMVRGVFETIGEYAGRGIDRAISLVGDFGESVKNVFTYGVFASDESEIILQLQLEEYLKDKQIGGDLFTTLAIGAVAGIRDEKEKATMRGLLLRKIIKNEIVKVEKSYNEKGIPIRKDDYVVKVNGVKLILSGLPSDIESEDNRNIKYVLDKTHPDMFVLLDEMTSKFKDLETIRINSLYRDKKGLAIGGHQYGIGMDITHMKFKSEEKSYVFYDEKNIPSSEPAKLKQIRLWLGEQKNVLNVYTPWQVKVFNEEKGKWIKSDWKRHGEEMYKDSNKHYDLYRMWTHHHHMHIMIEYRSYKQMWNKLIF